MAAATQKPVSSAVATASLGAMWGAQVCFLHLIPPTFTTVIPGHGLSSFLALSYSTTMSAPYGMLVSAMANKLGPTTLPNACALLTSSHRVAASPFANNTVARLRLDLIAWILAQQ